MTTASKGSTRGQGVSMLDAMVAGTFEQKAAKVIAPKGTLTPVPGEAVTPLVAAPAPIPNHPALGTLSEDPDIIVGRLKDARAQAVAVVDGIDRLLTMWGQPAVALAQAAEVEAALTEKEKARRAADEATAQSAGPQASKADQKKAEAAQARVNAAKGTDPSEAGAVRLNSKAELLKQMMEASPDEVDAVNQAVEQFAADFKAQQEAAQAAVYTTPIQNGIPGATVGQPEGGWVCPKHGGFTERTSSTRKVTFRVCPEQGCNQFEKK